MFADGYITVGLLFGWTPAIIHLYVYTIVTYYYLLYNRPTDMFVCCIFIARSLGMFLLRPFLCWDKIFVVENMYIAKKKGIKEIYISVSIQTWNSTHTSGVVNSWNAWKYKNPEQPHIYGWARIRYVCLHSRPCCTIKVKVSAIFWVSCGSIWDSFHKLCTTLNDVHTAIAQSLLCEFIIYI
jgi:hypothetical protein